MLDKYTVAIEQDGEWFIAYCLEVPGANGQGCTEEACRQSLEEAIKLILEDEQEENSKKQ